MIYNLGLRFFRNEEDALDFAQDVYLRAYDKLDSFRGDARASTWLYSLALNLGLNRLKKEKRLRMREHIGGEDFVIDEVQDPDDGADPIEQLSDAELERTVREELGDLPDVYRVPLILDHFEKMPYKDIAEHLEIKEGTLKSYLHRGKMILRERLLRREVEL